MTAAATVRARPRLGEHARALDRIERHVVAGVLLQLNSVPPGCEFVGPGLDGIDIAPGPSGTNEPCQRSLLCSAIGSRRHSGRLAAPDQRRGDDIVPVAADVSPNFDPLAGYPLHRIAAAVDQRINVLDMESTGGALDSLSCFVHGDAAIEIEVRSPLRRRTRSGLIYKPAHGHWFPRNDGEGAQLNIFYPLTVPGQFRDPTFRSRANRVPNGPLR